MIEISTFISKKMEKQYLITCIQGVLFYYRKFKIASIRQQKTKNSSSPDMLPNRDYQDIEQRSFTIESRKYLFFFNIFIIIINTINIIPTCQLYCTFQHKLILIFGNVARNEIKDIFLISMVKFLCLVTRLETFPGICPGEILVLYC